MTFYSLVKWKIIIVLQFTFYILVKVLKIYNAIIVSKWLQTFHL